jgi:transposase-like protein
VEARSHTPRGALDRPTLAALIEEGLTVRQIAARVDRSPTTVRYWIRAHGLATTRGRRPHRMVGVAEDGTLIAECPAHGATRHAIDKHGHVRCLPCRVESVTRRRRRVKEILVAEAGGRCAACGYDRYLGALQFHHVDPATKSFSLAQMGLTRSLARTRQEARKCVLLCANCHAEIEAGVAPLPR